MEKTETEKEIEKFLKEIDGSSDEGGDIETKTVKSDADEVMFPELAETEIEQGEIGDYLDGEEPASDDSEPLEDQQEESEEEKPSYLKLDTPENRKKYRYEKKGHTKHKGKLTKPYIEWLKKLDESVVEVQESTVNIDAELDPNSIEARRLKQKQRIEEREAQQAAYNAKPIQEHLIDYCKAQNKLYYTCPNDRCINLLLDNELFAELLRIEELKTNINSNKRISNTFMLEPNYLYCDACKQKFDIIAIKNLRVLKIQQEMLKEMDLRIKQLEKKRRK
jgi:hypothetical protein